MANSLPKISSVSTPPSGPQELPGGKNQGSKELRAPEKSFQNFVVDKTRDIPHFAPVISPAQHQAARRRLFDRLVSHILNEKGHPFSRLDGELKQDMINSITEELVRSHFKI